MLEFLVDNMFVEFAEKVFQQTVGIPMGTNCANFLAHTFPCSYEADCIWSLLTTGKKQLASRFNITNMYIDDVLSISNPDIRKLSGSDVSCWMWDQEHPQSITSDSYLGLLLSIGRDGQLYTSIYDTQFEDDFNFHTTNFPFLSSNLPSLLAYGVFI